MWMGEGARGVPLAPCTPPEPRLSLEAVRQSSFPLLPLFLVAPSGGEKL